MKYGLIGTWKMSMQGIARGSQLLQNKRDVADAVIAAIEYVENQPEFCSVGYGGLPNADGEVELDAAYMNGTTLQFGAIMAVSQIQNPIAVAHSLSHLTRCNLLAGRGAEQYALQHGFAFRNMLTKESQTKWREKCNDGFDQQRLQAYAGHDTVCVIGQDTKGAMSVGVSTSGLFMKHPGRVGDSPIVGSGYYCDETYGGAAATGVGEDIMRGCLSYEIVSKMKQGKTPQEACTATLREHIENCQRHGYALSDISLIAMHRDGSFGAATNILEFPFVVANADMSPTVFVASCHNGEFQTRLADDAWLASYKGD